MTVEEIAALADTVERESGTDNATDVLIEIALFKPDADCVSIRANSAGTKVIYTTRSGSESTHWAYEWTAHRRSAASALRQYLEQQP